MAQDNETSKEGLWLAKIIQMVGLFVVLLFIGMLYTGVIGSSHPPLTLEAMLQIQIIVPTVMAIAFYIVALKVKGWWLKEETDRAFALFKGYTARAFILTVVAGSGLYLGSEGVSWQFTLSVFLTSSLTLIFTFPTQERWK